MKSELEDRIAVLEERLDKARFDRYNNNKKRRQLEDRIKKLEEKLEEIRQHAQPIRTT